jgi:hypothetical protein
MNVHGLSTPCLFKFSESILMPLHRGAPRAPKVRWALRWLERKRLMAEILRGMQLMHLYLMLDAFNPILATAVLEAKDLPPFVMFSLLFPCVGKLKIAGIMQGSTRTGRRHSTTWCDPHRNADRTGNLGALWKREEQNTSSRTF